MSIVEEIIIILGISLDIFAVMECQGSLVAKIERRHLAVMCTVLVIGQALALGLGKLLSVLLCRYQGSDDEIFLEQVLSAVIFFCMGVRLLVKAWRNERVIEHRKEQFHIREFIELCVRNCVFTLLIGIALGFLGSSMINVLVLAVFMTVAATVLGMYTGYRLGFGHKVKAYLAGGILLIAAGADVAVRYMIR